MHVFMMIYLYAFLNKSSGQSEANRPWQYGNGTVERGVMASLMLMGVSVSTESANVVSLE